MKRKTTLLLMCFVILTGLTSAFAQNYDSTYNEGPINAIKLFPVKIAAIPLSVGSTDIMSIKIQRVNSVIPYEIIISHNVDKKWDTTIYHLPGKYLVTRLSGSNDLSKLVFSNVKSQEWSENIDRQSEFLYFLDYSNGTCGSNEQLDIMFNEPNIMALKYKWTPSEGLNNDTIRNPIAKLKNSITYKVEVTSSNAIYTDSVTLIMDKLSVFAGPDKRLTCGSTANFGFNTTNYNGGGTLRYKWNPSTGLSNDTIKNPTCSVTQNMSYTLTITTPEGCTATSSPMNVIFMKPATPAIGIVTVNAQKQNVIVWNKTSGTTASKYRIYKETNVTDSYQMIGEWNNDSLSVYVDTTSNAEVKSSKYKLSMVGQCDAESDLSTSHKTMHLSINKGQNNNWNLVWEPYLGFTVQTYNIYRGTTANTLSLIGSTSGSSTQFTDITAPGGSIHYQIEVVSPSTVTPSRVGSAQKVMSSAQESFTNSRSNVASYIINSNDDLTGNKFKLYPNPVKDVLYIQIPSEVQFDVYNYAGIKILSVENNEAGTLTVKDWKPGMYFIKTRNTHNVSTLKFIKE